MQNIDLECITTFTYDNISSRINLLEVSDAKKSNKTTVLLTISITSVLTLLASTSLIAKEC